MRPLIIVLAFVGVAIAGDDPTTRLVSRSPNGNFVVETEQDHRLKIAEDGTRLVGFGAEGPEEVIVRNTKDGKQLLRVVGGCEGPVEARWNKDSSWVILYWHGYRYNWASILVRVAPAPKQVQSFGDIHNIIQHDKRPLKLRDLDSVKRGKKNSPAFATRTWSITPLKWLGKNRIRLSATELARDKDAPHPFQIAVPHYSIDVRIVKGAFVAEALYADQDFENPIWKKSAEQGSAHQSTTRSESKSE